MDIKNSVFPAALLLGAGFAIGLFIGDAGFLRSGSLQHSAMSDMTSGLEKKTGAEFEHAFLEEMIVHHEGAIAMARMLLQNTERPELVQLASDIISAQTSEIAQMREWMREWFNH